MSKDFTVYQATNPATPPEVLAQMASSRPDLRQFVAANPATAPETLEWLGTLGDTAVQAALARRAPAAVEPPAVNHPGAGPYPPPGPYPAPGSAGPYGPPGGAPYGPPGGAPYGPPGGAPYEAPSGNPYAPAPAGYGTAPGSPGAFPQVGYGYQQEPAKSRTGLIVAIAVGAVVVIAALVFAASSILGSFGGRSYGEDQRLDRLWDRCAGGDGLACDDLYRESPLGSEYEEFGDTCGNRFPPQAVWCEGNI